MSDFKSTSLKIESMKGVRLSQGKKWPIQPTPKVDHLNPLKEKEPGQSEDYSEKSEAPTFKYKVVVAANPNNSTISGLSMSWFLRSALPSKLLVSLPSISLVAARNARLAVGHRVLQFNEHTRRHLRHSTIFRNTPQSVKLTNSSLIPELHSVAGDTPASFEQLGIPAEHQQDIIRLHRALFDTQRSRSSLASARQQAPAVYMRHSAPTSDLLRRRAYGPRAGQKSSWVIRKGSSIIVPSGSHLVAGGRESVLVKAPYALNKVSVVSVDDPLRNDISKALIPGEYLAGLGAKACWSWLNNWAKYKFDQDKIQIYMVSYQLKIVQPATADFYSLAEIPSKEYMDRLFRKLKRFRRSRFEMEVHLSLGKLSKPIGYFKPLLAILVQRKRRV